MDIKEQPPGSRTKGPLITQPVPVAGTPVHLNDVPEEHRHGLALPSHLLAPVGDNVNWTQILEDGGIPEPPGYQETVEAMKNKPKPVVKKKKKR